MNWFAPESHAQAVAMAALHKEGRVIRRRNGSGYLYAYAREFEALAAEVHADLIALREEERRSHETGPIIEDDMRILDDEDDCARAEAAWESETGR